MPVDDRPANNKPPVDEKLQKVLARAGIGSRREMERAIEAGQVQVNDVIATLGARVKTGDRIRCGTHSFTAKIAGSEATRVLLYNKPEGQICSRSDPEGRPSVYDNLPHLKSGRWISVGRLDFNTSGLLLFTTDGDLANKLMHPSSQIDREYLVRVQGEVDKDMLKRLRDGVFLEDGMARFTDIVEGSGDGANRWFYCVVMEGRNREVRRLWESQEVRVSRLKRVRFGNIFIPSHVRAGQWIELSGSEVAQLCTTAGVAPPPKQKYSDADKRSRERHQKRLRASSGASVPPKKPKRRPS